MSSSKLSVLVAFPSAMNILEVDICGISSCKYLLNELNECDRVSIKVLSDGIRLNYFMSLL